MTDLLEQAHRPCPWCKSTDWRIVTEHSWATYLVQVACDECGARGPVVEEFNYGSKEVSKKRALVAWNDGWEPSETDQGLTPIPEGYAEQ